MKNDKLKKNTCTNCFHFPVNGDTLNVSTQALEKTLIRHIQLLSDL